jgi:hypothetical protein
MLLSCRGWEYLLFTVVEDPELKWRQVPTQNNIITIIIIVVHTITAQLSK